MSILHTIRQDEIEWQRYLSREKARLDALNWEKSMEAREARAQAAEAKAAQAEATAAMAEAKLEAAVAKAEADIAAAKAEAKAAELQGLIDQIRLREEFLAAGARAGGSTPVDTGRAAEGLARRTPRPEPRVAGSPCCANTEAGDAGRQPHVGAPPRGALAARKIVARP